MTARLPELKCALCNAEISSPRQLFRATGAFLPTGDPLTHFCNAPLHWECYARWPERPRFARHYVDAWVEANHKNPFWWAVHKDERVYISVNPARGIEQVSLRLYAIGSDVRIPLPRWADWLASADQVTPDMHPFEKQELGLVLPFLRERFPDDHAIVDAIDGNEKTPRRRADARA
jgi:hypothetical protein